MSTDIHAWGDVRVSIGWSASAGFAGEVIRAMDSVEWCGMKYCSRFNHVFWVFDWERGPTLLYESHVRGGVQVTPIEQLETAVSDKRVLYYYLRDMNLSQNKAVELWDACAKLHGKSYDKRHILGLFVWIWAYGRSMLKRPGWLNWALNDVYICSELTEATARAVGIDLCGEISTPATSTPESQFLALIGLPSEVTYTPGRGHYAHSAIRSLATA